MKSINRLIVSGLLVGLCPGAAASDWKTGTGKVTITPKEPVWMAGYASRTRPSEGAVHDLWAKALAIEDPSGRKAVIVALDICGIPRSVSHRIRDNVQRTHQIAYDRIVLACSHTHSGPVIGENLITMYPLDDTQRRRIAEYTEAFERSVLLAINQAFERLEPSEIAWDTGKADFAVNRRTNKEADVPSLRERNALEGPVDHDVPVLRVRDGAKRLKAVVFGYACHCTVMSAYTLCGDYAGFTQIDLESRFPGAQAMFVAGCGADQNPLPRRTLEIAERYGKELASSVQAVVERPMRPVEGLLVSAYEEVPLRLGELPDRKQIELDAKSSTMAVANRAKALLKTLDIDGKLASTYPYPVQVWRIGDLTWLFLGGEVVVDYSLRFKRNLGSSKTWVSAYCNDVMAYIPSARVLKEGGYEGATAMIYYGLPTSWSPAVEDQIVEAVNRILQASELPD
jgi:hypothetical protein